MKKILLSAFMLLAAMTATAQISAFKQGNSVSVEGYSLPRTVVAVAITQEREVILKGPYSRYASQYLGIATAPQSDKESYKIIDAQLSYYEEPDPTQIFLFDEKSGNPAKIFNFLTSTVPTSGATVSDSDFASGTPISDIPFKDMSATNIYGKTMLNSEDDPTATRMAAIEKSPEQMAADAADVIFRIRKKRLELITGDLGEGVFGAGLKAALEEMDKLEAEYVALFIGKRYTQVSTKIVSAVPEVGKTRLTMCRFSDSKGVVPTTDVSGRPINVELTPERVVSRSADPVVKKAVRFAVYRIPQMNTASLMDGQNTLATMRIPIFQAGTTAEVPIIFGL